MELAFKYNKALYKTQYSEILVEYKQGFYMNTEKLIIHPMATFTQPVTKNHLSQ